MKKFYTLIIAVAVVLASTVSANASLFRFGVKLGMNVNHLSIKDPLNNFQSDNGCGFTGGLMVDFTVPVIGLGAEVSFMYNHMNADVDRTYSSTDPSNLFIRQSKNFLEIPVNLKYKIGIPVVSPYVITGPSFAFSMGSRYNTKDVQYSWNFGAGLEIVKHLQIQASYSLGINNIFKEFHIANPMNDIKLKNNYWTITAAYLF